MIKWSELAASEGTQSRSFEQLCYQVAKKRHGEKGCFVSVDDSGGGDGVEFYMTLPNGDQWGWQAKFYSPERSDGRLSRSNRKQKIQKSLKKACEKHPCLKKWYLCTPTDFSPEEQEWFDKTLRQSIPEDMCVELCHWGSTYLEEKLCQFSRIRNYFFGGLEFDLDWFKTKFDDHPNPMGEKIDPPLYTETLMDDYIHALLCSKTFVLQIIGWIRKLEGQLPDLEVAIDDPKSPIPNGIKWDTRKKREAIEAAKSLQDALMNTIDQLKTVRNLLDEEKISEAQVINLGLVKLKTAFNNYREIVDPPSKSGLTYRYSKEGEEQVSRDTQFAIRYPRSLTDGLWDHFLQYVIDRCQLINQVHLNIFAEAGIGKTHTVYTVCASRLRAGLPALFIRGREFEKNKPLRKQLIDVLGISNSWKNFLKAMSEAAKVYNTRIPLIIDGLNEFPYNETYSDMSSELNDLVQEISKTKNIVLITTCRTSYKDVIWGNQEVPNSIYSYGFSAYEVEEAVKQYFNAYKINADLTEVPLGQFEHPIYLKIFCNIHREKCIYVGEQTLFKVFEEYLEVCNKEIFPRPRRRKLQKALSEVAKYLWDHNSRHIPLEDLARIVDNQSADELEPSSKTYAIEGKNLLMYREWDGTEESMHFTYDLFGGYVIARYLIEQVPEEDMKGFLCRADTVAALFGKDLRALHPLHADIGRCLAALLLTKTGEFLHDLLLSNNDLLLNKKAFSVSINALFEISPEDINEKCIEKVANLFEERRNPNRLLNRRRLLELATTALGHPNHPFNALFWSDRLSALSIKERESTWLKYLAYNYEDCKKILIRFEEACQSKQKLSDASKNRLHLLSEYIMWFLVTPVDSLYEKARRTLYWYGRLFPRKFFELVIKSLSIDSFFVHRHMLKVTYDIATAQQHDCEDVSFTKEMLPYYGKQLYAAIFRPDAPHSAIGDLAHEYAKRTIDLALMHHPDLLTDDEKKHITL